MEKQYVTEEMHPEKEWFEQAGKMEIERLPEFINHIMNDYVHDYGTACHAVAACALAAAWATCGPIGLSGFQAGFVMWDFIRQWNHSGNQTSMRLIDYDNMLYPQYEHKFEKTIDCDTWKAIQKVARRKLQDDSDSAHSAVVEHWQNITRGIVPFGYRVVDDV